MNVEIENYCKRSLSKYPLFEDSKDIKKKLDYVYEKSPSFSNLSILARKQNCGDYKLKIEITSINNKFNYEGMHNCIKEGFHEALRSLRQQLLLWNKNRFINI